MTTETVMFSEVSNLANDTKNFTQTDENGQFSLQIPKKGYIHITPIGAIRKTIPVKAENQDLGDIIIQLDNSLTESVVQPCNDQELKDLNANKGRYLKPACQPTECKTPRYVLKITNDKIYSVSGNNINTTDEKKHPIEKYTATCEDQVDKPCTLTTTGVESAKYIANGTNDIKCIPSECDTPRYKLEHANSALAQCVDQDGKDCNGNTDPYARGSVYEYDKKSKQLNCVSASCIDGYTLDTKTKKCNPSECTTEQEKALKAAHATSWKLDDNKQDCIPTKCKCGYGTVDGQPVGGTCDTPKWSWDNDTPPDPGKIKCDKDNASEAYMDCRADGKAYCRVHKCDETNGFTLYGNECIQDACDPEKYPNALYVKRVGDECIIQECETGYNVNKKENKCEPRDDLLSEEDSEARIKELQENEDAVAENAQTWENKLLGTAGIGGAGAGGQMLASGIAQRVADEAAERDMTAYLATFRCKYGNESVDSGGDEVQLPGANDKTYASLLSEYKTLAASLKMRKNALGMAPGIESDEILDGSTLYGRDNTGGADGTYLSLADALSGDKDAQKEWDDQKEKANALAIGGGVLAGGAIIGTAIGSAKVNKDAPKNKADEINKEYDKKRGTIVDEETAQPAKGGDK